jgi:hypothetical protein
LPLAKLPCAPTLIILWVLANDWVMANDPRRPRWGQGRPAAGAGYCPLWGIAE